MTVLVTGGAGYIGSLTVRALRADGRDVVVLDDLSTGSAKPFRPTFRSWSATSPTPARRAASSRNRRRRASSTSREEVGRPTRCSRPGRYFRVKNGVGIGAARRAPPIGRASGSCSPRLRRSTAPRRSCPSPRICRSCPRAPTARASSSSSGCSGGSTSATGSARVSLRYFNAAGAARGRFDRRGLRAGRRTSCRS